MKNKWVAVLLAIMAGGFGVHRFYLRQPELGLLYIGIYFWMSFFKILSFPLSTLLGWYDAYRLLMLDQNEFDRRYNSHNLEIGMVIGEIKQRNKLLVRANTSY